MNKKGFTLIEIIICIALIAVIGTASVVGVNIYSNKKETNILEKNSSDFENALEVYLSEHSDVVDNVNNNAKAAVVSLELLKNEGLISDNLNIDYKNNYYTLLNAVLLSNESTEDCSNQISLKTFASWKLDDKSSEVIYICPRDKEDNPNEDLKKRIESLESALSLLDLNSKNYVLFDVKTNKDNAVYWPEENQDLWAIVSKNSEGLKLIYNNYVNTDNTKIFHDFKYYELSDLSLNSSATVYTSSGTKSTYQLGNNDYELKFINKEYNTIEDNNNYGTEYNLLHQLGTKKIFISSRYDTSHMSVSLHSPHLSSQEFDITSFYRKPKYDTGNELLYRYNSNEGWHINEIIFQTYETGNSKKQMLYKEINSNLQSYIKKENYYYKYAVDDDATIATLQRGNDNMIIDKFGTLSPDDNLGYIMDILIGKNFGIGTFSAYANFETHTGTVTIDNGNVSFFTNDLVERNLFPNKQKGYLLHTTNYMPVITVENAELLTNLDDYPTNYKNKYTACTNNSQLGTKECPRIIKFNGSQLSWE